MEQQNFSDEVNIGSLATPIDGAIAESNIDQVEVHEDMPRKLSPERAAERERVMDNFQARFRTARRLGRTGLTQAEVRALNSMRNLGHQR